MLVDDVRIKISAGHGGKGSVAFNKNMKSRGPVGGSGGKGGSLYAEGIADLSALWQFRFKKEFSAENGHDGRGQFRDGRTGEDFILKLPVGTVVHNLTQPRLAGEAGRANGTDINIEKLGEKVLLAQGGIGGKGNFQFRSATNTTPREFQPGRPGEAFTLRLELKFIADVGFVGLPNVGKSTMLNTLTNARSKVANYPFTTLEPSLGAYYELILADIPGLIEGSSTGRGLGFKFLRHIERTHFLFHFISAESPDPILDYKTIRKELGAWNKELTQKPERVFLTKSDLVTPEELEKKLKALSAIGGSTSGGKKIPITALSIEDPKSIKAIEKILNDIKSKK